MHAKCNAKVCNLITKTVAMYLGYLLMFVQGMKQKKNSVCYNRLNINLVAFHDKVDGAVTICCVKKCLLFITLDL